MAPDLLIKDVSADDCEQILAVHEAAFGQPQEAKIVARLWREGAVKIERAAEIDGKIVGHIAYSPLRTEPPLDGALLGLAPLAVAPSYQRQGVGAALVCASLDLCRERNARLITVLGDPAYYARFGFAPASSRNMAWSGGEAGDAFRIIAHDDIDADTRRIVHYHHAFDDES